MNIKKINVIKSILGLSIILTSISIFGNKNLVRATSNINDNNNNNNQQNTDTTEDESEYVKYMRIIPDEFEETGRIPIKYIDDSLMKDKLNFLKFIFCLLGYNIVCKHIKGSTHTIETRFSNVKEAQKLKILLDKYFALSKEIIKYGEEKEIKKDHAIKIKALLSSISNEYDFLRKKYINNKVDFVKIITDEFKQANRIATEIIANLKTNLNYVFFECLPGFDIVCKSIRSFIDDVESKFKSSKESQELKNLLDDYFALSNKFSKSNSNITEENAREMRILLDNISKKFNILMQNL